MNKTKLLLIEDDLDIQQMIEEYLEDDYDIKKVADGKSAIEIFEAETAFAVVLLDLMLPKKNGAEVLQAIRQKSFVPIIIISAKDSDFDKSVMLELGADDYLTKPFSLVELKARIKSVMRRASLYNDNTESNANTVYNYKDLKLDIGNFTLDKGEQQILLTATEFEMIKLFIMHPKKVFTKEDIYQSVWKENYYGDEHIVNVHMSRLREKLEENTKEPKYIETLWGIGYRLKE